MTDQDLLARADAFDSQGRLILWTPEAVGMRMIEAASVIATMPMRIGPKRDAGYWPQVLMIAQDLIDDETQERVLANPRFNGEWVDFVDGPTKRRLSENIQSKWDRPSPPARLAVSRAEEALHWPALYLADRPLLADALTLWAMCLGTGASLRASLRKRAATADAMVSDGKRHAGRLAVEIAKRTKQAKESVANLTRQDVMPEKNFHLELTWRRRKEAAQIICDGLRTAQTVLREATEDVSPDADE